MVAACDHVEEVPLGLWTRASSQPRMWMLNQLHVAEPQPALTADALLAELDRGLADVGHRRAQVGDDETGRRLAEDIAGRDGWNVNPVAVMVLDADPPEPPAGVAREVDAATLMAVYERATQANDRIPAADKAVVIEGDRHMLATIPGTRCFVGARAGVDACGVMLYTDGATGQPEDVHTLPGHRGHGLAAAAVSLAARESVAAGCDLTFLVCDAATGPVALYAGLGFRVVGRYWAFTRPA